MWMELKNGVIAKNCPGDRESIYDIEFCIVVCQLDVGDDCNPELSMGDDVCQIGTRCDLDTLKCIVSNQGEAFLFQSIRNSTDTKYTKAQWIFFYLQTFYLQILKMVMALNMNRYQTMVTLLIINTLNGYIN